MNIAIVKISGKYLENFTNSMGGVNLIKNLQKKYKNVILIHGGGKMITEWAQKMGINRTFLKDKELHVKKPWKLQLRFKVV